MPHIPVLLNEVIDGLKPEAGDVVLDCTVGSGGTSSAIARAAGGKITLIGIDRDSDALQRARAKLSENNCMFFLFQRNFRELDKVLSEAKVDNVTKVLFDLGFSTDQLESSGRGFSFQKDEPLRMTFAKTVPETELTAFDVLNQWDEENLVTILESYGEEKFAKRIARGIIEARKVKPIATTFELVDIIKRSVPPSYCHRKIHPATKTFQAIRIAVNDEIQSLKEALEKALGALRINGRVAAISFHSLEDRVVKNYFKDLAQKGIALPITKKPLKPSDIEVKDNPRSRSAKLRIIEKIS